MSTRHQKSFVVAAFVAIFIAISSSAAGEGAHNLILIIPEALPAVGVDQSNAPALARLTAETDRPRWHWPRLKRFTISFSGGKDK